MGRGDPCTQCLSYLVTFNVTVVAWCRPPLTPVIVRVKVFPAPAVFLIFSFNVLVVAVEIGVNDDVLAFGEPLTLKVTGAANPFMGLTVTV